MNLTHFYVFAGRNGTQKIFYAAPREGFLDACPASFAELAAGVFRPKPPEGVATGHVHAVAVSVPEQAGKILETLKLLGAGQWTSFGALTRDCTVSMQVVGRFLALLELYKAKAVDAQQEEALGQLDLSWTGLDVDPAVVAAANWD